MISGFIVGVIRFGLEFGFKPPLCGSGLPDDRPEAVKTLVDNFHFLHFGGFSFVFTCLMAAIVAFMTEPIPENKVRLLLF